MTSESRICKTWNNWSQDSISHYVLICCSTHQNLGAPFTSWQLIIKHSFSLHRNLRICCERTQYMVWWWLSVDLRTPTTLSSLSILRMKVRDIIHNNSVGRSNVALFPSSPCARFKISRSRNFHRGWQGLGLHWLLEAGPTLVIRINFVTSRWHPQRRGHAWGFVDCRAYSLLRLNEGENIVSPFYLI